MFGCAVSTARYDQAQQPQRVRPSRGVAKPQVSTTPITVSATASRISSLVAKWL